MEFWRYVAAHGWAQPTGQEKTKCQILAHLAAGMTFKEAAEAVGFSERTLRGWRKDDIDFAEAAEHARASGLDDPEPTRVEIAVPPGLMPKYRLAVAAFNAKRGTSLDFHAWLLDTIDVYADLDLGLVEA